MEKNCERCGQKFECKADDIANCDCRKVALSVADLQYLSECYQQCLCVQCLQQLLPKNKINPS